MAKLFHSHDLKGKVFLFFMCIDPLFIAIKMLRIQYQLYQNIF